MAKDKNKKQKMPKVSKQPISMLLVQNKDNARVLSNADKAHIYTCFRKRVEAKSGDHYFDNDTTPVLLRLLLEGTQFPSTVEMLVKVGSFKPLMSKPKSGKPKEVGFEVELKSFLTPGKKHRLHVLRKKFRATLFITL